MNLDKKGKLVGAIIQELKFSGRKIDEGDTFFSLCFKPDHILLEIAKRLHIKHA